MTTYTLEELRNAIGREAAVSDWITITQELIAAFAEVTGDHQWIHVDPERARQESPFGTTVAHGFLTLSLLARLHLETLRLVGETKLVVNYGFNRVRFVAPVPAGSRVRAHFTPSEVRDVAGGVEIVWATQVEIEDKPKPAVVADWVLRVYV